MQPHSGSELSSALHPRLPQPVKEGSLTTSVPFAQYVDDMSYAYTALGKHEIRLIKILSCPSPVTPGRVLHGVNSRPRNHPLGAERVYLDGEMHIRICHADITTCKFDYTALSYCWGDPTERRTVFVHDLRGNETATLSITASLYSSLQRAQHTFNHGADVSEETSISSLFWADGICIRQDWDQEDPTEDEIWSAEKAAQVQLMGSIYRGAISCLIDLGEESEDSHLISDFGTSLVGAINTFARDRGADRDRHMQISELSAYGLPLPEDPRWTAWTRFLARPWFRRVWIVQEYLLSRAGVFMYGSRGETLPLDFLPTTAYNLQKLGLGERSRRHAHGAALALRDAAVTEGALVNLCLFATRMQHGQHPTLLDGLINAHSLSATDLRDKAYSLLGMCAPLDNDDLDLRVEYGKYVTCHQVLLRFTKYILRNERDAVQVLYVKDNSSREPSWLPDWANVGGNTMPPMKQYRNGVQIYRAGGEGRCDLTLDPTSNRLTCHGYLLDEVFELGPAFTGGRDTLLTWVAEADNWVRRSWHGQYVRGGGNVVKRYPDCFDFLEAYARVLVGDNPPNELKSAVADDQATPSMYAKLKTTFDKAREGLAQEKGVPITTLFPDAASHEVWDSTFRRSMKTILDVVSMRRVCITREGRIGLVPSRTKRTDSLVLLKGAVMPFAARAKPSTVSANVFELLGGAYVHGVMYGEAIESIDRGRGFGPVIFE